MASKEVIITDQKGSQIRLPVIEPTKLAGENLRRLRLVLRLRIKNEDELNNQGVVLFEKSKRSILDDCIDSGEAEAAIGVIENFKDPNFLKKGKTS